MQNIPTYIARKHGKEQPDYLHEKLKNILKKHTGNNLSRTSNANCPSIISFSASKADILEKPWVKKSAEMERQKKDFIDGAVKNEISKERAVYIFQLVKNLHNMVLIKVAAAYALIAFQTAC